MRSTSKPRLTRSRRATLARSRIAAACGGVQTAEFKRWRQRAQAIANECQSGERDRKTESRQAARHVGWIEAEIEFRDKHPDRTETLLGFSVGESENPHPLIEDVRWAYQHAMVYATTEADAPSPGAWLWLLEARENRSAFLGKLFALEQAAHGGKLPGDDSPKPQVEDHPDAHILALLGMKNEPTEDPHAGMTEEDVIRLLAPLRTCFEIA